MASHIERRKFLATLGGAAVAWPVAARAQQPALPVIGLLSPTSPDNNADRLRAFRAGLAEHSYVEGQNVAIDFRSAEGRLDRLPAMAADFVRRQVTVIAVPGSAAAALDAKAATTTIPIVFGVPEDPVKLGLVASLPRPGGNMTGINFFVAEVDAKRLGLLHELVPATTRVAALVNPANVGRAPSTRAELEPAARVLGLRIQFYDASTNQEIDTAYATLMRDRPDALFVAADAFFSSRRVQLISLAARHALPAIYSAREFVEGGGLISYGTSITDMYRQVGAYCGRILKGEKPADLPVVQTNKFELVINLQTAKLLGLELPAMLVARADEVIE
jgi:putative tryptophan/tyrosine transport system substrate-binding protein